VMEFFPRTFTRAESDAIAERIGRQFAEHGFGLWAVELPGEADFIGFVGLAVPTFEAHFTPAVEVGWRLARAAWGRGYATEGARAALAHGFEALGLEEIVSFTTVANARSRRVMEKLGMRREGRLRRRYLSRGVPRDWVVYSVLAAERAALAREG